MPVRQRCNITSATAMLCFDDSLIDEDFFGLGADDAIVLINSTRSLNGMRGLGNQRIISVDGKAIARRNNMGKVVNSALLGAFVAALNTPDIDTMCSIIDDTAPAKKLENVAACREAYKLLAVGVSEVSA